MYSMNRFLIISMFCLIFVSCAKTTEQEIASAIDEAEFYLDSSQCSKAISILDEVGSQKDNADYVRVYASALACQAGYADLDIIGNLSDIDTTDPAGAGFIKSFAGFASSSETTVDETTYTKVFEGIRYILEANGGASPSTVARLAAYGTKAGNDLSMQALMMITTALGKYFALYGNADDDGNKGAGSITGANTCIYSYAMADAVNFITTTTPQSCTAATGTEGSGFLEAPVSSSVIKTRLCEGVVLFNNLFDILGNIDLSSNSSLGNISSVQTLISTVITAAEVVEAGAYNGVVAYQNSIAIVRNITGMTACEALDIERLEKWYAILIETIY